MKRMLVMLLTLLPLATLQAKERIEYFQSDLQISADGSMEVVETIRVKAEGRQIKRGIYRDFPTVYRDRFNNRVKVRFEVLSVRRDGKPQAHHTVQQSNGVRLYIGSKNVFLPKGVYEYEITYKTDRQLGFFKDHDELYWNVTGNDWAFPIDKVKAYVYLPKTVPNDTIKGEAYTGVQGSKGQDYQFGLDPQGVAWYETTRRLRPREGLTLVTTWPKGYVHEPTAREQARWFLEDNGNLLMGLFGIGVLLLYYLVVWLRVGRDPDPGVVFARYQPPKDYSPAAMRYIRNMGYDEKTFSTALVSLAAKGYLNIDKEDDTFSLECLPGTAPMEPGERVLLARLFPASNSIVLDKIQHQRIRGAMDAHKTRLEADYEKKYFQTNGVYVFAGLLLSILAVIMALMTPPGVGEVPGAIFMTIWLSIWSTAVYGLLKKALLAWKSSSSSGGYASAIFISLFSVPFVIGWFAGIGMMWSLASGGVTILLLVLAAVNWGFYELMKAPTLAGRELLDKVDGFMEYLSVAEADELRFKNPPHKTPELFERYLPYAIALDVEGVWGEKFTSVLAAARRERQYRGPSWYRGPGRFTAQSFTSSLGSGLASGIASSSTAPGSASGSGGGGSSGGGGGGGGGGGW